MKTHNFKSVIYLTTPTSATASMWRIFTTLTSGYYEHLRITDTYYESGKLSELLNVAPPQTNNLILFNTPNFLSKKVSSDNYKFLINIRDPRDLVCNQYYWALQHPVPNLSADEIEARHKKLLEIGIDNFAKNKDNLFYYQRIMEIVRSSPKEAYQFVTYAQLCMDFDNFIKRSADFLNVEITENHLASLDIERIDKLGANPAWIGNQWQGSDIWPGRHKRELKTETITKLNFQYREVLDFLREFDEDSVSHTYSE